MRDCQLLEKPPYSVAMAKRLCQHNLDFMLEKIQQEISFHGTPGFLVTLHTGCLCRTRQRVDLYMNQLQIDSYMNYANKRCLHLILNINKNPKSVYMFSLKYLS